LRNRKTEIIRPFLSKERLDHIMSRENQYPILSWRIGDRSDTSTESSLMYWVRRGGGYPPIEEEVEFFLKKGSGGWRLSDFTAVY
jgi:hypothetical protein